MTKAGRSFESNLMMALEEWVDGRGKVIFFAQSRATRGNQFLMSQPCDVIVDSREDAYSIGLEAKSINTESAQYGMYFSSRYKPKQVNKQVDYQEQAGRPIYVAFELRNYMKAGDDSNGDHAYLVAVEKVADLLEAGEKRVEYEWVEAHGVYIGSNGDYHISERALEEAA